MNFIKAITSGTAISPAALTYTAINEATVLAQIRDWMCGVMVVISLLFGGWELYTAWHDDQPSKRKHGITVLIVGISIPALIYTITSLVISGE